MTSNEARAREFYVEIVRDGLIGKPRATRAFDLLLELLESEAKLAPVGEFARITRTVAPPFQIEEETDGDEPPDHEDELREAQVETQGQSRKGAKPREPWQAKDSDVRRLVKTYGDRGWSIKHIVVTVGTELWVKGLTRNVVCDILAEPALNPVPEIAPKPVAEAQDEPWRVEEPKPFATGPARFVPAAELAKAWVIR